MMKTLLDLLVRVSRNIIDERIENKGLILNPNDPKEHDFFGYHQFGIITHTQKFLEAHENNMRDISAEWGSFDLIKQKLSGTIGRISKFDLLELAIGLHDIGKFSRNFKTMGGMLVPDYKDHEKKSEVIIMENNLVQDFLRNNLGLTSQQIDYIARCAGLHFELGKARYAARETQIGYSFEFIRSDQFKIVCREIVEKNEEFAIEIGILFLGDSLAKTDIVLQAKSDEQIQEQIPVAEEIISKMKLDAKLIASVTQLPVNIAVARRYLEIILKP